MIVGEYTSVRFALFPAVTHRALAVHSCLLSIRFTNNNHQNACYRLLTKFVLGTDKDRLDNKLTTFYPVSLLQRFCLEM